MVLLRNTPYGVRLYILNKGLYIHNLIGGVGMEAPGAVPSYNVRRPPPPRWIYGVSWKCAAII